MIRLSIPDMSCGHCTAAVAKTVAGLDPSAKVVFDLTARHVDVTDNGMIDVIITALKSVGFSATVV
jgi:copper chaperone